MIVQYSDESYEKELMNINTGDNGFVYALADHQNQLIYVELIFRKGIVV